MTADWSPDELELIDRYLAGVATPDEGAQAEVILARDPGSARRYRVAVDAVAQQSVPRPDGREMWTRLWSQVSAPTGMEVHETSRVRSTGRMMSRGVGGMGTRTLRGSLWVAGAIGMLAILTLLVHHESPNERSITRTYATTASQQARVTLDDGTRVILAPQTTLRLVRFGALSRDVVLDRGEAYFEVARASGSPFVVRSGAVVTRVLGTEFLVRRGASNTRVRIAVEEGKVRVTNASRLRSEIILTPGQIGDVMDSTVRINTVDGLVPGIERTPGQLRFYDTPVSTVLQTVSQWYGYQFRYDDHALAQRPVTVVISTQSSAAALSAIAQVLAVSLTVAGDTVTLTPHPVRAIHGTPRARTYDVWIPTKEVGR